MSNPIDKEGLELARTINAKLVAIRSDVAALEAALEEVGGGGGSGAWADITDKPAAVTALSGTNTGDNAANSLYSGLDAAKAPIASPTFTGTVTIPSGASIAGYLTSATAASTYAPISTKGTRAFANEAALMASAPDFAGQLGYAETEGFYYTAIGTIPGAWADGFSTVLLAGDTVTATTGFTGPGANITSLSAANLTGNIARARIDNALSANAAPIVATTVTASGTLNVTGSSTLSSVSTSGLIDVNITSVTANRETIFRAKVSDASNDAFHIYNGTVSDAAFAPGFSGSRFTSNGFAMLFVGQTTPSNDSGGSPLVYFQARIVSSATDPNNSTFSNVVTRPLFGWFKADGTGVGQVTAGGQWQLPSLAISGTVVATPGARSGPGAVPINVSAVALTTTGVADALTLANGTNGQILTISHVSRGGGTGTAVLTPTTSNGYTTITFTATGDSVALQYYSTGGWHIIGSRGVTIA